MSRAWLSAADADATIGSSQNRAADSERPCLSLGQSSARFCRISFAVMSEARTLAGWSAYWSTNYPTYKKGGAGLFLASAVCARKKIHQVCSPARPQAWNPHCSDVPVTCPHVNGRNRKKMTVRAYKQLVGEELDGAGAPKATRKGSHRS